MGITKGCNPPANDRYCPAEFVTRAQMASFLARMVRLGDERPPEVSITSPNHLQTFLTSFEDDSGRFTRDITFTASATDPNGDSIVSVQWFSSVEGFLGAGNPLTATLSIPPGRPPRSPSSR